MHVHLSLSSSAFNNPNLLDRLIIMCASLEMGMVYISIALQSAPSSSSDCCRNFKVLCFILVTFKNYTLFILFVFILSGAYSATSHLDILHLSIIIIWEVILTKAGLTLHDF